MGFIHRGLGEIDVVRCNQRNTLGIGHFNKSTLGEAFRFRLSAILGMALEFHIEPISKGAVHLIHQRFCRRALPPLQQFPNRTFRSTGEADQACASFGQLINRYLRQLPAFIHIKTGIELHQVLITLFVLSKQHYWRRRFFTLARLGLEIGEINLTADNRLHTFT